MNKWDDLSYKQLLFPPYRKETGVEKDDLPVYSAITPVPPPFYPYRIVGTFSKFPSYDQQIEILKQKNFPSKRSE